MLQLQNLLSSWGAIIQGHTASFPLTNKKNQIVNHITISGDDISWTHEEADAASSIIKPRQPRSDRTWIIRLSTDASQIYNQLIDADAFLALGDAVILTTEPIRSCISRYEGSYRLHLQHYHHDDIEIYRGLDVVVVRGEMLISDYIRGRDDLDSLDLGAILGGINATQDNMLWRPIDSLLFQESLPAFPSKSLGATLGQLVDDVGRVTGTEPGLAGSVILSMLAHVNLDYSLNGLPLNLYVLGVAESAGHKSNILQFLKKPIEIQYLKSLKEWEDSRDEEDKAKPFKNFFGGSRVSVQGIANELIHGHCSMMSAEAVAFFDGYGFSESNRHTASVLASMFSAEDVDTVLAKGRTVLPIGRRLNICLLGQVSALDSLLRNESSLEIGLSARFLIHKQPKIDFNIERTYTPLSTLLDEFGSTANNYYSRIQEMLGQRQQPNELMLSSEAQHLVGRMYRDYNLWLGDKHPRYATNNNEIVKTFVLRMAEHATRIAGNLFLFENQKGDTVGVEYVERGRRLVEYYYCMLASLIETDQSKDIYDRLMVGIFERQKKGRCKTVAEIRQAKILRDPNDSQRALDSRHLNEIMDTLEQNGYLKRSRPADRSTSPIVRLHPEYDPISKSRRR